MKIQNKTSEEILYNHVKGLRKKLVVLWQFYKNFKEIMEKFFKKFKKHFCRNLREIFHVI